MKVQDFVLKGNMTTFRRYRKGYLYYAVEHLDTHLIYEFPVPLENIGDATFNAVEKASMLMRYIRTAIDEGTMVYCQPE